GFVRNDRNIPSSFRGSMEEYTNLPAATKSGLSRQFSNTLGVNNLGTTLPSQNFQLVFGNSYFLNNHNRLGFILSTTYRNTSSISQEVRNDYNEVNSTTNSGVPLFEYQDTYYNFSAGLGMLANVAYSFGGNKIAFKNLFNKSFDDSYLRR